MRRTYFFIAAILALSCNNITGQSPDYNYFDYLDTYHTDNAVLAGQDPEWDLSAAERLGFKLRFLLAYNGISYLSQATWEYNCHHYAWFKTENYPGVNFWVNDPSENWYDLSFVQVASETFDGKVTYYSTSGAVTHSAVTTSTTGRYKSKWGQACLFEHDWDECPYYSESEYQYAGRNYYKRLRISGPSTVCTSSSTYSLQNLPAGTTATWSVSPSSRVSTSSGSGTSASISAASCTIGDATITFAINDSGTIVYESKQIHVVGPDATDFGFRALYTNGTPAPMGGSTYLLCANTHYHIYLDNDASTSCGVSNLTWTIPSGWTKNYQSSNMISIYTNSSPGGQVTVKGQTCCSSCGSNVSFTTGYFGTYYSCGGYYMASPNPGSEFIDISLADEESNLKSAQISRDIRITIYNNTGSIVHTNSINELPYRINTSELPIGSYVIRIMDGNINETIRVLVDH
jgi:hypothetical protein